MTFESLLDTLHYFVLSHLLLLLCDCLADFLVSAAVAEFKGPDIFGVVRFAQVSMELARIEANFNGLSPGTHSWSINEYGDLTKGAASTGNMYNPFQDNTGTKVGQANSET